MALPLLLLVLRSRGALAICLLDGAPPVQVDQLPHVGLVDYAMELGGGAAEESQ